jgi:hypothetical protein
MRDTRVSPYPQKGTYDLQLPVRCEERDYEILTLGRFIDVCKSVVLQNVGRDQMQARMRMSRRILRMLYKKLNSVALVRKLTIPAERPPLVGEVSGNFLWIESFA